MHSQRPSDTPGGWSQAWSPPPPSWDAGIILLNGADIAYSHAKTYIGARFNFIFRSWVKIPFSETGPKDDLPSLIWTPEGVLLQEMAQRA